jgi:hypothetical protein
MLNHIGKMDVLLWEFNNRSGINVTNKSFNRLTYITNPTKPVH